MLYPLLVYSIFSILATVGLYLIVAHFRSRSLAIKLALGALIFFVALMVCLVWLMGQIEA